MQRLYFMAPNVNSAKEVVNELLLARIDERHIHVIARDDTPMEDLPSASLFQRTDLAHAIEQGLALGGATGALAGLVAIAFPGGLILGGGAVLLATTLAGAGIGAWSATFRALNIPNTHLRQFEKDIQAGCLLMLVDVPSERADEIRTLIQRTRTDVHDRGSEPAYPHL